MGHEHPVLCSKLASCLMYAHKASYLEQINRILQLHQLKAGPVVHLLRHAFAFMADDALIDGFLNIRLSEL